MKTKYIVQSVITVEHDKNKKPLSKTFIKNLVSGSLKDCLGLDTTEKEKEVLNDDIEGYTFASTSVSGVSVP